MTTALLSRFLSWHRAAMAYAASPAAGSRVGIVLLAGYALAIPAAYLVCRVLPISTAGLEEARRLGMISRTIFTEYPKGHEWTVYLAAEVVVALVVLAVWWGWALWVGRSRAVPVDERERAEGDRDRGAAAGSAADREPNGDPSGSIGALCMEWLLVSAAILWVTFDIRRFVLVGDIWTFFEEEGLTLATINALLRGGVLYRDVLTAYGPLVFLPAQWLMQLFGPSTLVLRGYCYVLDYAGFLVLYYVMKTLFRHRGWALAGLGFFLLNFSMPNYGEHLYRPSAQSSVLRYTIGLAWLAFYVRHESRPSRASLAAAGLVIGLTFALSVEMGLVSCVALTVFVATGRVWPRSGASDTIRDLLFLGAGLLAAWLPLAGLLAPTISPAEPIRFLGSFMTGVTRGYSNLPFPPPGELLGTMPHFFEREAGVRALEVAKGYWIPLMLNIAGVILVLRWLLGRLDADDRVLWGLVLMGAAAFRIALGVSDVTHLQPALVPTVLVGALLLRRLARSVRSHDVPRRSWTAAVGFTAALLSVLVLRPPPHILEAFAELNGVSGAVKFRAPGSPDFRQVATVPRARGLLFLVSGGLADEFEATVRYIVTHTAPNEPVIAFPNEGAYYFYAERPNASRRPFLYEAMTRQDRLAVIAEWELSRPRYVIYSLGAQRMHGMPAPLQLPELYGYVKQHFVIEHWIGQTLIMRRREAG